MANLYKGNAKLNDVLYNIVKFLLQDDKEEKMKLKKLLYYSSKNSNENGKYINIYKQDDVVEDLYNKYIYPYNFIENTENDNRSLIKIFLDNFAPNRENRLIEEDVICIEINVPKSSEAIKINNKIVSRSVEIKSLIQNLLDGQEGLGTIGEIIVRHGGVKNIQNKYISTHIFLEFKMRR